jgi:site-specific DNA-methyltransferase (adenine-specific)
VEVAIDFVKLLSPAGGIVFDPMIGTGTTAVAAHLCGRHYIGIEIDPEYHAAAVIRTHEQSLAR